MVFSIYADTGGTNLLWTETQPAVVVEKGVFNVLLGSVDSIPYSVFDGSTRYLGVKVGDDPEITPRKPIVSVAYAYRAGLASDNDWDIIGDVLFTHGAWGIARYGNVLYGNADSTHVNLGVACTTGASGQNYKHCTIAGGIGNLTVDGATVGGGWINKATGNSATIGGGGTNTASGEYATIGGGYGHTANGYATTVGGGYQNASGNYAFVGGGYQNQASGQYSTVGGGNNNTTTNFWATVGGGHHNTGGYEATVGGGDNNTSGYEATVGGGHRNTASGGGATIAGGDNNTASGNRATVGGGLGNTASGYTATVGGGVLNIAGGDYATVPGGCVDTAAGAFSFAAGSYVNLTSDADYSFAFGSNFTSSTPHAVIFYDASSPIKVGVQVTAPTHYIDVVGGAYCNGSQWVDASSKMYKKDIQSLAPEEYQDILKKLAQTEVVRYRYKSENNGELHIGVIAENAPEEMVDAERIGIPTGDAIGFLMAALKAQQEEIEALKAKLKELESNR
jgi:hypothetical protein